MKLCAFDIPDDAAMLPSWLEGHLMGLDLRQLVTELEVIRGATQEPKVALADVLGTQRDAVLQAGLQSLSRVQLRQLLRQPQLLLEVQRLVLDEGGDYWTTLPVSPEIEAMSAATWQHLQQAIKAKRVPRRRPYWPIVLSSLATAAAILLLVYAHELWWRPPASPSFAWSTPEVWPHAGGAEYLTYLADQAEGFWLSQPPATPAELAQRLGELRLGCSVLLVQEQATLGKEDQEWLRGRCLRWATKLDAERARLESGGDAVAADVQAQVDVIVADLAKALRARRQQI